MVGNFNLAPTPKIIFGIGKLLSLPKVIIAFGRSVLFVTGKESFINSEKWCLIRSQFIKEKINWKNITVDTEPSPKLIDDNVAEISRQSIDVVVAIGGGSVIDAGKAISAMIMEKDLISNYLEGLGNKQPSGNKVPFIAIPTTSGTGSEATKNAVLSDVGKDGFKKSLRHDNFVPNVALIDPSLTLSCPKSITVQSGMDAFTQLLESYVSTKSNAFTDSLAMDGIRLLRNGLHQAVIDGSNIIAREKMSYSSLISGITLANAGLGTIHGFASSIGGFINIPHGLVCAKLMGPVNKITVEKLISQKSNEHALYKYARVGQLFNRNKNRSDGYNIDLLLDTIMHWTTEFSIRGFSEFGLNESDFRKIISKTGNKNNPIELDDDEMAEALKSAL